MITKFTYIKGPKPNKSIIGGSVVDHKRQVAGSFVSFEDPILVDPVLENNDWSLIKEVCVAGEAANYWAVGDTKKVVGGDTYERNVAIVDMTGLYGKEVVFQFMDLTDTAYAIDADNFNGYSASDMNVTYLAAGGAIRTEILTDELASELTDTTVKVAKNGNNSNLVEVTNKLFLPAERELWTTRTYSIPTEFDALSTFEYWQTNTSNADHVLKSPGDNTAHGWWTRSPYSGDTHRVCLVNVDGSAIYGIANYTTQVAPCFSF